MGATRNTGPFFLPQSLVARACHRNWSPLSQNDIHVLCPGVRKAQGWRKRRSTAGRVYASRQGESLCRTEWPLHPSCLHNRRDLSLSAYRAGEIREKEFWEKLFSLAKPTHCKASRDNYTIWIYYRTILKTILLHRFSFSMTFSLCALLFFDCGLFFFLWILFAGILISLVGSWIVAERSFVCLFQKPGVYYQ